MARLRVGIDGTGAARGASVVKKSLNDIRGAASRTDKQFDRTAKRMDKTRKSAFSLGRTLRLLGGAFAIRGIFRAANAYQEINNRLRLVTDSSAQLAKVTETVFDISQRNRIGFESTAELYQRVARSSEQLGLSLDEVAGITDTVAKAITISGVSAQSANAAIVQLGQGLAAGALRGDELRSVLEQTPRLARAIADGLGVPIGKLRELGQAGKLSGEAVVRALQSQADVLESEFGETVPTISQAFTVLQNSITRTIGIFTESTGAAGGFADILISTAKFIQGPLLQGLLRFGDILGVTFEEFGKIGARVNEALAPAGASIGSFAKFLLEVFTKIPLFVTRFINRAIVEIVNGLAILKTRVDSFLLSTVTTFEKFQNALVGTIATIIGDDAVAEQAAAARVEIEQKAAQKRLEIEERLSSQLATLEADRLQLIQDEIAQELKLEEAVRARAAARLAAAAADTSSKKETANVFERPAELQKVIDNTRNEFEQLNVELKKIEDFRALKGIEQDMVALEALTRAETEAWDKFAQGVGALDPDPVEQARMELERILAMQAAVDPESNAFAILGKAAENLNNNLLDARLAALGLEDLDTIMLEALPKEEQFEIMKQRLKDAFALHDIVDPEDPRLVAALEALEAKFKGTSDVLDEFAKQAARNLQDAFADFLFDPFEEGLDGMLRGFSDTLRRMASELLAQQILKSFFGALSGGGNNIFGTIAGQFADGGTIPAGQTGLVGERGPELITPRSTSTIIPNEAMGGAAPQVNVDGPTIVNTITDGEIVASFNRGGGGQVVLNDISERRGAYRQALGLGI